MKSSITLDNLEIAVIVHVLENQITSLRTLMEDEIMSPNDIEDGMVALAAVARIHHKLSAILKVMEEG